MLPTAPHITKDGVTVAKEVELADAYQNTGAQLVKEVASKTGDDAGDGTTTATVLAQAIVAEGLKNVTAGASPIDIKRGIDKAVAKVVESIKSQAETVGDNYDKIEQVGTVSANNDPLIGKLIADAMRKVSKDGVITISSEETWKERRAREKEEKNMIVSEIQLPEFSRSFKLPEDADTERIHAESNNGVLVVSIPRIRKADPGKIEIKIGK